MSGGGDSIALLHLMARAGLAPLHVVTVDHGLRAASAEEARQVAALAARLGLSHDTLRWQGWDGQGNLQDRARDARRQLIAGWAAGKGVRAVALAHTMDDQAETLWLRLRRGSGVDGLAAMAPRRSDLGLDWLRPLLGERRQALRDWLAAEGIGWIDDPSNEDPRFDRVRARQFLAGAPEAPGVEVLAATSLRMAAARQVLAGAAAEAAEGLATVRAGALRLGPGLMDLPDDTLWRLVSAGLCLVSGQGYRPRFEALRAGIGAVAAGRRHTLHGCVMRPDGDGGLTLLREARATRPLPAPGQWEGWRVEGPELAGAELRALGPEGLARLDDWRGAAAVIGVDRDTAMVTPGVWLGDDLCGAPGLAVGEWRGFPIWDKGSLKALLLSH